MTQDELRKRLIMIRGQDPHNTAIPKNMKRRGENFVEVESDYEGDEFDNFFNFEEDLADMESARRQVERLEMEKIKNREFEKNADDYIEDVDEEQSFFTMSEFNDVVEEVEKSGDESIYFTFDEALEIIEVLAKEDPKKKYDNVVGFEFKYCSFIKKDGVQCKRQSPKNNKYCGTHRKYIDKHGE